MLAMKQNTNQLDNQHLFSHQYFNSKQKSNLSKLKTSSYYFNLLIFLLFTNTGLRKYVQLGEMK